jgi:hypothetical protein
VSTTLFDTTSLNQYEERPITAQNEKVLTINAEQLDESTNSNQRETKVISSEYEARIKQGNISGGNTNTLSNKLVLDHMMDKKLDILRSKKMDSIDFQSEGHQIKSCVLKNSNIQKNTSVKEKKASSNNDENADLGKYEKMLKIGIPIESVFHKMKVDGIQESSMKRLTSAENSRAEQSDIQNETNEASSTIRRIPKTSASISSILESNLNTNIHEGCSTTIVLDKSEYKAQLDKDVSLTKYVKMTSVGVPPQSVRNKMEQDSIPKEKIELFEVSFGLRECNISCHSSMTTPLGLPKPPLVQRRTSVKMQKIHWKTVSEEKVGDSLWADSTNYDRDIDDKEVEQLESLFAVKKTVPSVTNSKKERLSNSSRHNDSSLIEMKRANNIAISLAQYRKFKNYDELCEAVICMDSAKLNSEQIQNMKALLPTTDELKRISAYKGVTEGLVRAELFFLSVSKFPRFARKVETFHFALMFETNLSDLELSLSKLDMACTTIVGNKKLAAILRKLLAMGNLVNEGAGKPRARGITIDSLIKTAKRTGSDGKTSVIYLVVANCLKQDESGESVNFWNEMGSVKDATKIDIKDCQTGLKEIQTGMTKVQRTIDNEIVECTGTNNGNITEKFVSRSNAFINRATEKLIQTKHRLLEVEESVLSLCSFFAEDCKSCKVHFSIIQIFAVQT